MKKLVAILFFSLTSLVVYSQVTKTYFSDSTAIKNIIKEKNLSLENTPTYTMPKFDLDKLMEEDKRLDSYDVPYRFGKAFDVSYSLEDGVWQDCEDGRIWSISFSSRKAQSLNFVLNDFFIPNGAKLFITNKSQNVLYGPVCNKNIGKNGFFLTDIIPGDEAMFFLYEPKSEKGKSNLTIKRIVHGYRFFSDSEYLGNDGASAPCNINVACRPSFEKESHAIGLVLLSSGYELCSGSLLMTTDMSFKPYFLTAFHCIDIDNDFELSNAEISAAENWMFMFNYKKKECDGNILANSFTYNSANFKSAWYCTDFALMEIADSLQNNLELSWLGWDRTGNVPTSGNCIHHPCGDVMKINTVNSSFGTSSWNGDNNHWYINWDEGITQGGSSGAPFLNQNKLVVGQNHGKAVSQNHLPLCDRKRSDGGKFHLSWTGGQTNSTRLSNWLDPENTNSLICQTHSSAELLSISGPEHPCGTTTYSVANLPTGYTVDWSIAPAVSFFNSSILTTNSPQQNQCTITNTTVFPWSTTLFAAIKNASGTTVTTLSKRVRNTFDLTFSQSGFGSYPSIPASTVVSDGTIVVNHKCWVTLSSEYFDGMTILHTGASPQAFEVMFDGSISFKFATVTSTQNMTILGQDGCKVMRLLVQVSPNSNIPIPMLTVSPNGDGFEVELTYEGDEEDVRSLTERLQDIEWELNIANAVSGEKVRSLRVRGPKTTVSTVGWKPGIYVLQGTVNGQECSKKVTVK